jgi:hypothetical protein
MAKLILQSAKIVGLSDRASWSQVHTFIPTEPEKLKARGQLLAAIGLKGIEPGIEAVAVGREVISRIHEEYYGDLAANPLVQLKRALIRVMAEVKEGAQIEIAASAVAGKVLYLAITGEGEAVLQRGGKIATVAHGEEKEVKVASGYLKDGDTFIVGTAPLFKIIPRGMLQATLGLGSAQEAADALTLAVHGRSDGGAVAAVIVQVGVASDEDTISEIKVKEEVAPAVETPEPYPAENEKWRGLKESLGRAKSSFQKNLKFAISKLGLLFSRRFKKPVYLAEDKTFVGHKVKERFSPKTVLTVAIILMVILGVSMFFGSRERAKRERQGQYSVSLAEAVRRLDEGEQLISLNLPEAQKLILEAQDIINKLIEGGLKAKDISQAKSRLDSLLPQVLREHKVEGKTFFDLELIKVGAEGSEWVFSNQNLYILDKSKNGVYSVDVTSKQSKIIAGGEQLNGSKTIAVLSGKVYVLTDKEIIEIDPEAKKQKSVAKVEEDWGQVVDIGGYLGNLYLLADDGKILRLAGGEGGFTSAQLWLKDGAVAGGKSIVIDGSVWVLNKSGEILKYTRGIRESFKAAGLEQPFSDPVAIETLPEIENLYILDRGNSRVVVLSKSGEYRGQYIWEGMKQATGVVALEDLKKILLLSGSKIFEVGM